MANTAAAPRERTEDARFDKVYSDPRFMVAPNKVKKVQMDDPRFSAMVNDPSFNQVAKVDKRGRKVDIQDKHALQNVEVMKKPKLSKEEIQLEKTGAKFYDKSGNFTWQGSDQSSQSASADDEAGEDEMDKSLSSGSENLGAPELDSASYSDDISGVWSDMSDVADQIKTTTADKDDLVGKRIAVTNLDWDTLTATDLFVLFTSFCHS